MSQIEMHAYLTWPLTWKAKIVDSISQHAKCVCSHYCITVHYVQKSRSKFFCNTGISYKTRAMLTTFGTYHFLNKLAVKRCKRFPPHLNNVSSLPCDITETFWSLFFWTHCIIILISAAAVRLLTTTTAVNYL